MVDYGTLYLPSSVQGHFIVFIWPNDSPGDHWNNFINILNQGRRVSEPIVGIAGDVIKAGTSGSELIENFS
jgi:hypothetical protein